MHAPRREFFDFHEVIRSLEGLSDRQQITTLKFELFHALERESEFRAHCSRLEQSVAQLLTARTHCDALEELCRSLLLTIEQAARSVAESDAPVADAAGHPA